MQDIEIGRLIYLLLLGGMLCGWFVVQARLSLNRTLQQAAVWALIFVGAIAAYGLWGDIRSTVLPQQASFADQGRIVVPRHPDGHYYLTAQINNTPVEFVVDTGATNIVLTQRDAVSAGLDPDGLAFLGRAMTANGEVKTAGVTLDTVTLGFATDHNVRAVVNSAEMPQSLLGMSYLQKWGRIEISDGELVLTR